MGLILTLFEYYLHNYNLAKEVAKGVSVHGQ